MKHLFYSILIFCLYGCGEPYPKEKLPEIKTVFVHDTILVPSIDRTGITETIKKLLNDYYKAGWMDAQNSLIDLHNSERFNENHIDKNRFTHWRKMEVEINNKNVK